MSPGPSTKQSLSPLPPTYYLVRASDLMRRVAVATQQLDPLLSLYIRFFLLLFPSFSSLPCFPAFALDVPFPFCIVPDCSPPSIDSRFPSSYARRVIHYVLRATYVR